MKLIKLIIFLLLAGSYLISALGGDEIELTSAVDADKIGLDDILYFTVQVKGKDLSDVPVPKLPEIEGFTILGSSRSSSRHFQIIGSRAESSLSYNYVFTLKPVKKGVFTLPSIKINYKNVTYSTTPIKVEVSEGSVKKASPQRRRGIFDDFFNDQDKDFFNLPRPGYGEQREIADEVILERTPSEAELYVGEQLVLNTYLYASAVDIYNVYQPSSDPSLEGFWIEEVTINPNESRTQVQKNGRLFTRFTMRTQVLFPTKPGEFIIPATSLEMNVRRSGFGIIGFSQNIDRKSNTVKVKVKPLPREGMPADFSGAIGNFDINLSLSKKNVAAGEAVNLTVTYSGIGNTKDIQAPPLKNYPDFTIYGPEQEQDISLRGMVWGGKKSWKYILVPKSAGEAAFGPFTLSYFDPKEGRYITRSTPTLKLAVKEGTQQYAPPEFTSKEPALQQSDINYISGIDGELMDESVSLIQKLAIWFIFAVPALANIGVLAFGIVQARRKVNVASFRSHRAASVAFGAVKDAGRVIRKGDVQLFYDLLIKAIAGFFADKWNTSAGGLTLEQVRRRLGQEDKKLAETVLNFLEECEYYRFAAAHSVDKVKIEEMLSQAKKIISKLDKVVR